MRKLYVQLYLALLAATVGTLLAVGIVFRLLYQPAPSAERLQGLANRSIERLRGVPDVELNERLAALGRELSLDLVVWDGRGELIAVASRRAHPGGRALRRAWEHGGGGVEMIMPMGPDRLLGLRTRPRSLWPRFPFLGGLLILALVMAIGAYPVSRRLARRLETLAAGVARWGQGDLGHRVAVEGRDEVATLADTFNKAAAQVDLLVTGQRELLANASHELRSPLARLRMALELMGEQDARERRAELVEGARRDIVDLDGLIEDLLLMARADGRTPRRPFEAVDLGALLTEEAARAGASVTNVAASIHGDPLLLRHLMRNLLENAERHAGGKEVQASIEARGESVTLVVEDRGPGIPEAERDRIFAPFYRPPGADPAKGGAGIGLALVRQVARYHGGEARALARDGGGSRFEVTLPLYGPVEVP